MKKIITIAIFILWSSISYSQITKDSLAELQSLLDSIPDISLAELGIDTTAEIVPDTLHLVIPASIESDTTYARTCLNQAIELIKTGKYEDAYAKADTAKHIYQVNVGYVSKEVADCLHQMGRSFYFVGKYDEAILLNKNNLLLRIKLFGEMHQNVALSLNLIGILFEKSRNYDKSIKCLFKAISLWKNMSKIDSSNLSSSFNNLGVSFQRKGEYDKAIGFYEKALAIRLNKLGISHPDVALSYNNLGASFQRKGEYDKAIDFYEKALGIRLDKLGISHIDVASSYSSLGTSFQSKGEYDKAVDFYEKAMGIRLDKLGISHPDVALSYNNLGTSFQSKGEYYKAIDFYEKALNIQLTFLGENHLNVANSYIGLGSFFQTKSEYDKAIGYFEKALNIQLALLSENHPDVATSFGYIGNSFLSQGEYDKAIKYYEKALTIRMDKLGTKHSYVSTSLSSIGSALYRKGEYYKAFEYYEKALNIQLDVFGENHPHVANSFNNIGLHFNKIGEFNKALEYHQKALDIQVKLLGHSHPVVARSYNNLGVSFDSKGEYNEAIKNYLKGLDIRIKTLGPDHPDMFSSQRKLSSVYQKLNQLDSSLYYIQQAISGIKTQMSSDISAETKNLYQSQNIPVIESAIDVSLIKSKQDQHDSLKLKTYEYTELAKASLLQSQIKQNDALAFAGIPDSLFQKEYDLRIDINWREKQRQGLMEKGKEETDQDVLRISSIIFDLKREQEGLFETLEKDYPEYYRLKYDTKTINLEDTQQKLLQKEQTMLEYFVGDSSIFIFVVRPDTFDVVQVKKDFPLDSLVRQMQTGLYGYHGQSPDKRTDVLYKKTIIDYTNAAHELYSRIVTPVSHLLTPDLVIIPDGVLGYVPFEALLKSKPEKLNQFATYPYMINDHTISYNYSATLWQEMKNKKHKKEPSKSLVAFAPFYEGTFTVLDSTINLVFDTLPDGRDTTIFQDIVSRKKYDPLPSSGIEAGTVSKLYKGDYFVNSDATEQKFYDVAGDYRMVHLSTHGVADARQGDYSYLAFAEQKDSIENEFLYVRDIYNTQFNADLVFLSACETAQGELQRGEGIISLARAFAYAGAKSIITTLWQVDDTATKDISIDFYKNLKKGNTKDTALRNAKLRHIKSAKSTQKHPFFWAAMIGIGDMGALK